MQGTDMLDTRTTRKPVSFRQLPNPPDFRCRGSIPGPRKRRLIARWIAELGPNCGECGREMHVPKPIEADHSDTCATIDHIRARCLGGTNRAGNLRVICRACNGAKSEEESRAAPAYKRQRKRMLRARALKAARTRARNKARRERRAAQAARRKG